MREFRWQGRQTGTHAVSATIPAEDIGEWVHLVGTYDGVNWNLYRNGTLLASRADTVGCVPLTTNWYIGSSNGNARFFDGEIRDVAIWNTSLTASQAAAVYAETAPSADYVTSVTTYTYDALDRLTSLTDPVGNTTTYTYNYMGLVATETNEKNATRYYTYDTLGRLVQKTDRNDRVTTYAYDSVGRLTAEHWGNTSDYFMYTYDLVGNLLYTTDGDHSYSYTYDSLYRPTYVSFDFDSQSAVFSYTYDAVGRQMSSSLTLNGHADRVNTTTYDYLGNATSIRQHGNITDEIFAEFDYNANGLLTAINRYEEDENDVLTSVANSLYEYNANNAVTSITHNNATGSQIVKHSYTYDETNNIIEYLNSLDGSTEYNYDFLGQLIGADHANQTDESYVYDENGNRVTANGDTYTTGTNNELTSDGDYAYTYDAEGNRISKTNSAGTERELYTWDYRNRLTTVTKQTYDTTTATWTTVQIVEYAYDYNNIWIRKTVGDSKTIFIPENYQTTVQIDNGAISHHYLWMPNAQDKLLADTSTDGVSWSLTDHLGTIRDVLDVNSSTHLIYDAFGNLTSGTNPLLFGYTGKAFDTSTNLQNNINRWYDAAIGRWLSTDPIGFEGNDTNLYRYVGNSIICNVDTLGLFSLPDMLAFIGEQIGLVNFLQNESGAISGTPFAWWGTFFIGGIPVTFTGSIVVGFSVGTCGNGTGDVCNSATISLGVDFSATVGYAGKIKKPLKRNPKTNEKIGVNDQIENPYYKDLPERMKSIMKTKLNKQLTIKNKKMRGKHPSLGSKTCSIEEIRQTVTCPQKAITVGGNVYAKGSIGFYVGYEFQVTKPINQYFFSFDTIAVSQKLSYVTGALFTIGGNFSVNFNLVDECTQISCCDNT